MKRFKFATCPDADLSSCAVANGSGCFTRKLALLLIIPAIDCALAYQDIGNILYLREISEELTSSQIREVKKSLTGCRVYLLVSCEQALSVAYFK